LLEEHFDAEEASARKTPAWRGRACPIPSRSVAGRKGPRDCIRAELEEMRDGFQLVHHFEHGERVANVGLIVQACFDFFGPLHHLGPDPNQRVLKVKRTGSRRERMFQFEGAGEALPLDVPFSI